MSTPKELKRVVKYAIKMGFTREKTGGGHIILSLCGRRISVSSSPRCPFAHEHARKEIDKLLEEIACNPQPPK